MARLWRKRWASGALLAAAAGLIAFIADPRRAAELKSAHGTAALLILADATSADGVSGSESAWEAARRDAKVVVDAFEPESLSVLISSKGLAIAAPPTHDRIGALLLLDQAAGEIPAAGSLRPAVAAAGRLARERRALLAVVSTRPREEIEQSAGLPTDVGRIIYLHASAVPTPEYWLGDSPGNWSAQGLVGTLRAFRIAESENTASGWAPAQLFALSAFLLGFLEAGGLGWLRRCRLRWRAGKRSTRAGQEGAASGGHPARVAALLLALLQTGSAAAAAESDGSRETEESLSPGISVITEVSTDHPMLGQQFSIVYRMRCTEVPAAIDVDPQDFAGFWSEMVPLPQPSLPVYGVVDGRTTADFLLRQLIAFPLRTGVLSLPALRLKIKVHESPHEAWDLIVTASPVEVRVLPPPRHPADPGAPPLAGSLAGKWLDRDGDTGPGAVLEIEGDANLEFFNPQRWLRRQDGHAVTACLLSADNLIQTRDSEGRRSLTLFQRRKWLVRGAPAEGQPVRITATKVPFFQPEAGRWSLLELPERELVTAHASAVAWPLHPAASQNRPQRWRAGGLAWVALAAAASALLVLAGSALLRFSVSSAARGFFPFGKPAPPAGRLEKAPRFRRLGSRHLSF